MDFGGLGNLWSLGLLGCTEFRPIRVVMVLNLWFIGNLGLFGI
jgi:hypothetical protein